MSKLFSHHKKFRSFMSSAISTVVMSSCASQVAQCWPFYCAFDPDKNAVFLSFTKTVPQSKNEVFASYNNLIFSMEKNQAVSLIPVPKETKLTQFFPFSSKKKEDVEKLVNLMVSYVDDCNKLCYIVRKLDNYKKPCDMNLLSSSAQFWSSEGFFSLLNQKSDASIVVYNSLPEDNYEECVNKIDALLGWNLTQKERKIAYDCLIGEDPKCIKKDKYMDLIGKLSCKLNVGITLDEKQKVYSFLSYKYPKCIEHDGARRLIDSLRKQSDEIKKLYNSLIYKIDSMVVDHNERRIKIVADRRENVYVTDDVFSVHSKLESKNVGKYTDEKGKTLRIFENRFINPTRLSSNQIASVLFRCDKMFQDFKKVYDGINHTNKDYQIHAICEKLQKERKGEEQKTVYYENGKLVPVDKSVLLMRGNDGKFEAININDEAKIVSIDEKCKPEDEWDWSWPHSGEKLDDLRKKGTEFDLDKIITENGLDKSVTDDKLNKTISESDLDIIAEVNKEFDGNVDKKNDLKKTITESNLDIIAEVNKKADKKVDETDDLNKKKVDENCEYTDFEVYRDLKDDLNFYLDNYYA